MGRIHELDEVNSFSYRNKQLQIMPGQHSKMSLQQPVQKAFCTRASLLCSCRLNNPLYSRTNSRPRPNCLELVFQAWHDVDRGFHDCTRCPSNQETGCSIQPLCQSSSSNLARAKARKARARETQTGELAAKIRFSQPRRKAGHICIDYTDVDET